MQMSTDIQKTNGNGATNPLSAESNPHAGTEAATRMAHDFIDRVAKVAGQSEEKLRKVGASAETSVKQSLDVARDKLDVARHKGDEVKTSVTGFIQQHPFAALGIAFGTGVLLSYLTRSSRGRVEQDDDSA
jgi:ElaB/YqjD/DUF883 family membrane-anchored ribosome-binding protein